MNTIIDLNDLRKSYVFGKDSLVQVHLRNKDEKITLRGLDATTDYKKANVSVERGCCIDCLEKAINIISNVNHRYGKRKEA